MTRLVTAAALVVAAMPGTALAQRAASDPEPGSPSGTVYELPLEQARGDAAPRRGKRSDPGRRGRGSAGASGAVAGARASSSPIRSENGFGSSSRVPGVPSDEAGSDRGASAAVGLDPASGATEDDGPAWFPVLLLIVLIVLVGSTAGVLAGRARRT